MKNKKPAPTGRPGANLSVDSYSLMGAPSAQALHTDHSDALPCGRKPDPRHVCPFWFVKLQVVGLANGPN